MKPYKYFSIKIMLFFLAMLLMAPAFSQQPDMHKKQPTKDEILNMSYEQLLNLPFQDLINLASIVGVSADELLQMILNKEVSTASKMKETVFESPLSTSVITKEEILNSGATTVEELFRLVPGMIVREISNGNYDVHIRGNDNVPPGNFSHFTNNSMTLVMINNRPVYNCINGGTFWETLPISLSEIERVDIIRGPSSALYGPNAVSGVINFITTKPGESKAGINGTAKLGSYNTKMFDMVAGFKLNDKLKLSLSGNYEGRNRMYNKYYDYGQQQYVDGQDVNNIFGAQYDPNKTSLPNPDFSKEKLSGNASLYYDVTKDINIRVSGGAQKSEIQTVFFESLATPLSHRLSNTYYSDVSANIYGLSLQGSYLAGHQNLCLGMIQPVIEYDLSTFNGVAEYNFKLGNLYIRPGVNYQTATYDDMPYVTDAKKKDPTAGGLLNGAKTLNLFGYGIRLDYLPIQKLRLVAAIRADKYNKPNDTYMSYQLASYYKLTDDHLVRAVFSKANRGSFIGDAYAQFKNPLGPQGNMLNPELPSDIQEAFPIAITNYYQYYVGNTNLKLLTMNQFEIGYRGKISKNLQVELEAFYTRSKDFNVLVQNAVAYEYTAFYPANPPYWDENMVPSALTVHDSLQYKNVDVVSIQMGVSAAVSIVLSKKLQFKVFGTVQQTKLKNYALADGTKVDVTYLYTPSFYGGFTCNYSPVKKLNIFGTLYTYSDQNYNRYVSPMGENGKDKIKAKGIVSINVAYKFYNENAVFVSGQNLLFNNNHEFGFTDPVKSLFTAGVNFKF